MAVSLFAAVTTELRATDLFFQQANLVSSVEGLAPVVDANLKNPWGISFGGSGPFWVSNQVTRKITIYNGVGQPQPPIISIAGGSTGADGPTGQVANTTGEFSLTVGGAARFLFATLDGHIAGWNETNVATTTVMVNNGPAGASYTGLAIHEAGASSRLYAADVANARIDAFDTSFGPLILAGSFTDPNLPAGYTPYNIQNLGGTLYVAYENATNGGGVINAFDTNGNLLRRVTSNGGGGGGALDDPWGMAIAPASFGPFAGALLVGNNSDGRVSAFDPTTGDFLGQLSDQTRTPIANAGLWGLTFGNGGNGGDPNVLYFAAGIQNQTEGLFGAIRVADVPEPSGIAIAMAAMFFCGRSKR